ncbi:MAG: sugar-binding protein [Polyangiales bacterium]
MARERSRRLMVLLALATPALAQAENHVGINVHVPAPDLIDLCANAGVSWVRMDGDWLSLNPARGRYEWTALDRSVDAARARGIRVFISLGYTPPWVPRVPRARADTAPQNDEPATSDEWRTFVTEAVRHYRARGVQHFGMWNEPNLESFWEEAAGVDPYIDKILVPGAAAVRAACADCVVLGPDLAHLGDYHLFLDRVLARARASLDVLTHHTYGGWPETGTTLFSGDNFLQTIETRRFPFTRPALREVLDARGYTGEVWITETGYRARPPGDAAAEERQAIYVRRALEEQLARPWWTHTFFYEVMDCGVDQVGCDIDGFGLARPLRPITTGARSFPADYRLKPAFNTLRDFIRAHPEIVSRAAPAACANGLDDDGDGRVDAADRGCSSGLDNSESDDPPRRRVEALAVAPDAIRVDGSLDDWSDAGWVTLDRDDWVGAVPLLVASDAGVRFAARWSAGAVYLAAEVSDDRHVNDNADDALWAGDSLQLAFDVARNYGARYDSTDDHELTFALARGAPRAFRFHGPAGTNALGTWAVSRDGSRTLYEVALPPAALRPASFTRGLTVGFSFLVNDNDGQTTAEGNGREGWLQLTDGIGRTKDPYHFGELVLGADAPTPPPADAGVTAPLDAGVAPRDDGGNSAPVDAPSAPLDARAGDAVDLPSSGCGCRTSSSGARGSAWSLAGLALLAGRRRRRRGLLALALAALAFGCSNEDVIDPSAGVVITDDQVASLAIVPEGSFDGTLSLSTDATSVGQRFRAVATDRDGRSANVSQRARWSVGGVNATQALAPQGDFSARAPGEYTVTATLGAQTARVTVRVRLVGAVAVEGTPTGADVPPATGFADRPAASVAYPPDGAIFPVNMAGVEAHIRRARGAQSEFSLRLSNGLAELTLTGLCRATQLDPAGCAAPVPTRLLAGLAAASELGPLELRATVREAGGAGASEAPVVRVSWANVPLEGALYYWSTRIGENTTAIHRMDLSRVGVGPERWYQQGRDAPEINGERPCVGCHAISRDGRRMGIAYGGSDPGSFALVDVATRRPIASRLAPRAYGGPATFGTMSALSPEGDRIVTVLRGAMTLRRADATLAPLAPLFATGLAGDDRATQPQWSDDGRLLAFVGFNQTMYDCSSPPCGDRQKDNGDLAPYGQVYIASVDGERVGAPRVLVPRSTEMGGRAYTNHYPAFSDDSLLVVFNRVRCDAPGNDQGYAVDRTGAAANCSGYDNPGTRVMIAPAGGGAPLALDAMNTGETYTNSWPRFGPTHGRFRGAALYWVAFSSKRPYGLRLPGDTTGRAPMVAPQLWLAAITLGQGDVPSGDPSAPAVWLAGQNLDPAVASGNHVPQWVRSYVPTPE